MQGDSLNRMVPLEEVSKYRVPQNSQACVPKMACCISFFCPNLINISSEKGADFSVGIFCVVAPVASYKAWVQQKAFHLDSGRASTGQIKRFDSRIRTHLWNPLGVMKRCIIHDQDGLRPRPSSTIRGRSWSIKSSKTEASVEPRKMRHIIIPFWVYAGRIWYRSSGRNCDTCRGATPGGDQPVRWNPIRLSHPDSST